MASVDVGVILMDSLEERKEHLKGLDLVLAWRRSIWPSIDNETEEKVPPAFSGSGITR